MTKQAKSIVRAQRDLLERVHLEGAQAAYEACLAICADPKAPMQAKSNAANTILRMGGYFDTDREPATPKEPHEMTAAELSDAVNQIRSDLLQNAANDDDSDIAGDRETSDLFG